MRILPAATGARRFVMSRSALRKECRRLDHEAHDLACQLVKAAGEIDVLCLERDGAVRAFRGAEQYIEQLRAEVADRGRLELANTALKAALENATKVSSLGATARPSREELAAAGRTTADTVELETVSPAALDTTAWKAPAVPQPDPHRAVGGPRVHTLAEAFGVNGACVRIKGFREAAP